MKKKARYDDDVKMDASSSPDTLNLEKATLYLKVPFVSAREAEIAYNSLRVDGEPKRSQVVKTLSVVENNLVFTGCKTNSLVCEYVYGSSTFSSKSNKQIFSKIDYVECNREIGACDNVKLINKIYCYDRFNKVPKMAVEEHTPSPQEARGIYGFVLFLFMKIFLISYFMWMFLPLSVIQSLPYAPPQQYWGIAVPVFFCTGLFMFAFHIYPALHGLHDCSFDDPSSLTDPDSHSEDYFDQVRARVKRVSPNASRKRKDSEGRSLKSVKTSAEFHEKSKTLSAKERKFRDMQIRPIRSFPASDTRPIPPVSDIELDSVCKKLYMGNE